jgi:hypothetical protein
VQTIVAGVGRATETTVAASAGSLTVVGVPIPASRPDMVVRVTSSSPAIAVAGLVTYQDKRQRPSAVSIITAATLDARNSAIATPGPGAPTTVTFVVENASGAAAHVRVAIGDVDHANTTVGRDAMTVLTLPVTAESAPLVLTSNTPVYAFRRLDDGTSITTEPFTPAV